MESKQINKVHPILQGVDQLKERYFGEVRGLLDELKNIFNAKPLESVVSEFYTREGIRMDRRKAKRELEKKSSLRKVNRQIEIEFP
jgi:hypothetical protein